MNSQQQSLEQQQSQQQSAVSYQQSAISSQQSAISRQCFHCGAAIPADAEICPHCGRPVNPNICTFCGSPLDPDDRFCAECGNPREGIMCPRCRIINFRSFCRQCNYPLNSMAQEAIAEAQADPKFQHMLELQQRMVELEREILENVERAEAGAGADESTSQEPAEEQSTELSEADRSIVEEYNKLLDMLGAGIQVKEPEPVSSQPSGVRSQESGTRKAAKPTINIDRMREITEAYKQLATEMNDCMDDLSPDPGTTPQMQRNYYSARKLPVITTTRTKQIIQQPVEWVCNWCGCHHSQPSECSRPQLGGKWIYQNLEVESVITTKRWEYED